MSAPPMPPQQQQHVAQHHQVYQQQYQQHPAMMEQQQHHSLGHNHLPHIPAPPPPMSHTQGYGMPPQDLPRGGSGGRRTPPPYRDSYRDRSYSPLPRHRRSPSPRGYRDSRGYERDMDYRGYDRGGYDRGYDRGGYDRSDRDYDRDSRGGYDRGYGRSYDRDHDRGYGRSSYDRGYGNRGRSPPRRSRTVNRGSEEDRLASRTLYVGNIPYSFREIEIEDMFKKFGTIVKITVVLDQYTGRNKGFAFVEFEDRKNAEEAMEQYNGFAVEGRRLKMDWDIGLNKKDIKPRAVTETTENSTAEASPQSHTVVTTGASTPAHHDTQAPTEDVKAVIDGEGVQADSHTDQSTELLTTHNAETEHQEASEPQTESLPATTEHQAETSHQEQIGRGEDQPAEPSETVSAAPAEV
ncbi:hypothetical protein BGZ98_000813 [Dissophora globulifera]|nr:hypothetical protein BGZ98_000813 [Dissophora globulifera]